MTKTYCDRCGKKQQRLTSIWWGEYGYHEIVNLCPECLKELEIWMKNNPA